MTFTPNWRWIDWQMFAVPILGLLLGGAMIAWGLKPRHICPPVSTPIPSGTSLMLTDADGSSLTVQIDGKRWKVSEREAGK